ncbi:hypothetical protein OKW41_000327 [Paraburkholderia sp. UCT70]
MRTGERGKTGNATSMPIADFVRGTGFLTSHRVWIEINHLPAEWLSVALRSSPGATRFLR